MKNILVLGGVSFNTMIFFDEFPEPRTHTAYPKRFHEAGGSTGVGKALNLCQLGFEVVLHGVIGADEYGDKLQRLLARDHLEFIYDMDPAGTQRHVNVMNDAGGRISMILIPGTFEPEVNWSRIEPLIARSDYVALNIRNYCREAIPIIQKYGKPIWVDIHDYDGENSFHQDFIEAADVLLMSSEQMPDYRPFMRKQIEDGKQLVICTHGKEGATAACPVLAEVTVSNFIEVPIIDAYKRFDTNGAGDSFFSGVLYGHAQRYDVEKCLRMGAIVSGLCITSPELAYEELSAELVEAEYQKYFS
jgi:sugar/nucleoside kinase (ribokinase family)